MINWLLREKLGEEKNLLIIGLVISYTLLSCDNNYILLKQKVVHVNKSLWILKFELVWLRVLFFYW